MILPIEILPLQGIHKIGHSSGFLSNSKYCSPKYLLLASYFMHLSYKFYNPPFFDFIFEN